MKKTWKITLFVLMLALALASLTACGNTKLDVAEGVYVTFSGADGSGRAEICFSEDEGDMTPAFLYKLMEKKKIAANDWETLLTLGEAVTYDLEPDRGLSNGDTVTVTIDVNESVLKSLNMTAKSEKLTFKVSGLTEVKKIQPFQNFEISFSGISPNVSVDYTKSEKIDGATVYYTIEDSSYPYRDGQEITFKASISDDEYYALQEDTKIVTVSGVDKYLESGSELLPETLDVMRAKADELMQERFGHSLPTDYFQFSNPRYAGYVFTSVEGSSYVGDANGCFLLYTLDVIEDGNAYSSTYYFFFNNILQKVDGTQEVNTEKYWRPFYNEDYFLHSYQTLDARCQEIEDVWASGYNLEKFY